MKKLALPGELAVWLGWQPGRAADAEATFQEAASAGLDALSELARFDYASRGGRLRLTGYTALALMRTVAPSMRILTDEVNRRAPRILGESAELR